MIKRALLQLTLALLFPWLTLAQNSGSSVMTATQSPPCEGLARACSAAADELVAARALIKGYEMQLAAQEKLIAELKEQLVFQERLTKLGEEKAFALQGALAAAQTANDSLIKITAELTQRAAKLERSRDRARLLNVVLALAAALTAVVKR